MTHIPAALGWVSLGIGAVLTVGLTLAARAARRMSHALADAAALGTAPGPLPAEIVAAIGAAPVREQGRAARAYRGTPVRWRVTFESAFPSGLTTLRLMCQDRGDYPWVLCDVRKGRFPKLRGLAQHAPLWVAGRVGDIRGDEIFLRGARLEFDD